MVPVMKKHTMCYLSHIHSVFTRLLLWPVTQHPDAYVSMRATQHVGFVYFLFQFPAFVFSCKPNPVHTNSDTFLLYLLMLHLLTTIQLGQSNQLFGSAYLPFKYHSCSSAMWLQPRDRPLRVSPQIGQSLCQRPNPLFRSYGEQGTYYGWPTDLTEVQCNTLCRCGGCLVWGGGVYSVGVVGCGVIDRWPRDVMLG